MREKEKEKEKEKKEKEKKEIRAPFDCFENSGSTQD
jgi:hypothetical protein